MSTPPDSASHRLFRGQARALAAIFTLSGASGLVFEVIWTRKLALVFGASTPAISTVLSAFMGGLALGSFLLGRRADRLKYPVLTYAVMEAAVGVLALLVPVVIDHAYPPVSRLITNHGGNSFDLFTLLRFLVVALVLLPPTTMMGATLPVLTRHVTRHQKGLGQAVGLLYAANTFGAVLGTFEAGFHLLPNAGLAATNAIAASLNLVIALGVFALRRRFVGAERVSLRELLPWGEGLLPEGAPEAASQSSTLEDSAAPGTEPAPTAPEAETDSAAESPRASRTRPARRANRKKSTAAVEPERVSSASGSAAPAAARTLSEEELIEEPMSRAVRYAVLVAACGSGFAALAYEVILTRALDMVIGSSVYSFTTILMAFLVGIGGGSALASAVLRARPGATATMVGGGAFLTVALLQLLVFGTRLSLMVFVLTVIVMMLVLIVSMTWRRPSLALGAVQLLIGIAAACTYYFQDKIPRMFVFLAMVLADLCDPSRPVTFSQHIGTVQFLSFLVAALCALPAAVGMGAAFPLAVRAYARNLDTAGGDTGAVYSINTLGSILGSFLTGFIIMPAVGMETAFYIAVAVNLALGLLLMLVSPGDEPAKYVLVPITAVMLALATTGAVLGRDGRMHRSEGRLAVFPRPWNQEMMTMGVFRLSLADGMITRRQNQCVEAEASEREQGLDSDNPIFYRDGVTTTVTVERWSLGDRTHFALKNNGKVDASNGDDMPTQVLVSGLPLLLHPRGPENLDVALVGWGSGVTVGTTLQFPIRKLDVIELERATVDASRFFTEVNHLQYNLPEFPYVSAPRLTVYNNDGRNYLAGTDRRYDVIISEPSNPWITGVSNLFTVDHFRAASRALAPGGVYLQWVQLYEMSPNNVKTIYRTFGEVFPYVRVFAADAYSSDTIVLGSFSPIQLDAARVDHALQSFPRARDALRPAHAATAADLFSRLVFSSREELMRFAQIEEHKEGGQWRVNLNALGDGPCDPGTCRRSPAPLNTDDNARIEFAAPRDLIGFDAFAGYTEVFYSEQWPYGRGEREITGLGEGEQRANTLAQLAVSLLAAGRPARASEVMEQALGVHDAQGQPFHTPMVERAHGIWAAITSPHEPALRLEPLRIPPDVSREGAQRLRDAYDRALRGLEQRSFRTALAEFADIPMTVRESAGPSIRLLYGYLLYRASAQENADSRFAEAADQMERLARDEPAWVARHAEVMFFISKARFRAGDFALAVAAMGTWVDMVRSAPGRDHEPAGVTVDVPEPPAETAPVTDRPGEAVKDRRAGD